MFNEVIYLIAEYGKTYDADGFETNSVKQRSQCYADVKSTTYKEYYEASRVDEKATDIFVVSLDDYFNSFIDYEDMRIKPSYVEYEGQLYKIIRRYRNNQKGNRTMELTCSEVE